MYIETQDGGIVGDVGEATLALLEFVANVRIPL